MTDYIREGVELEISDSTKATAMGIFVFFALIFSFLSLLATERIQEVDPCPGSHSIVINGIEDGCVDDPVVGTNWIPNIEREVKWPRTATLDGDRGR